MDAVTQLELHIARFFVGAFLVLTALALSLIGRIALDALARALHRPFPAKPSRTPPPSLR